MTWQRQFFTGNCQTMNVRFYSISNNTNHLALWVDSSNSLGAHSGHGVRDDVARVSICDCWAESSWSCDKTQSIQSKFIFRWHSDKHWGNGLVVVQPPHGESLHPGLKYKQKTINEWRFDLQMDHGSSSNHCVGIMFWLSCFGSHILHFLVQKWL